MTPPAPSRRERPAKPALTRDGIVAQAVGIMRAEGLEKVTMRRLAQELDTGAASLYVYVRNTAELHAAVLDALLASIEAPTGGTWDERLAATFRAYIELLHAHPSLARSALVTRPSGPGALGLLDTLLALLREGDVPGDRAAWGVDLLLLVATASAAEHGTRDETPGSAAEDEALAAAVRGADPAAHPHVAALATELLAGPGPDRLAWTLRVLVTGITGTPRP
ncbi:TetR/AcrR family transcriptional regulator [Phytomonospora endophytica]|uniref:AcrR family transcriptional regulator n=1 Tax=Phytomonospora endophytica TaxID=714109 RepID=A0A841FWF7_9ACTN|nr:TetR/AcrR family transcriptional regulator [Phytomonospora endophytica]MBB6036819.1 AcrR family transcriptional regulator [Phytomonospora endophytica]GIG68147.1 TetR family transcriptional regulator [Phytomonospora endophytica]